MEKVCNIIGLGYGATSAPWANSTDQFWGINNSYIYGRLDKLFVMHSAEQTIKSSFISGRDAISFKDAFLKYPKMEAVALMDFLFVYNVTKQQYGYGPIDKINVFEEDPDFEIITKTTRFPLGDATRLMGTADFSCSAAYLIAMAILEGFDRIRLYGFEVWSGITEEYKTEAPCIERWQKLAKGKGINTDISFDIIPTIRQADNLYGYVSNEVG